MDITAQYAQKLNKDNLQKNTINSYISDVRLFLSWKEKFAPTTPLEESLLIQYLKTSSFTRSKYTMRRKEISLTKFINWVSGNSIDHDTSNRKAKIDKTKYALSASALILLLIQIISVPTTADTETINHLSEYTTLDTKFQNENVNVESPIDISVDGVEIAVSGYEIQTPLSDPADVVLTLESNYEQSEESRLESLSPSGGSQQIEEGSTYTIILDDSINSESIITVTPTTSTNGNNLYIQSQGNGFAIVAIDKSIDRPLSFNWIAIN